MSEAQIKLVAEDPSLTFSHDEETWQTIIEGMGELHLEIIVDRMKCEYNVETNVASVIKGGSVPGEYIAGVQMGIETVLGLKAILVDGAYQERGNVKTISAINVQIGASNWIWCLSQMIQ